MLRRPVVRRRGTGLVGATVLAGTAYVAGSHQARPAQQEQSPDEQLAALEAAQAIPQPAGTQVAGSTSPAVAAPPVPPSSEQLQADNKIGQL